MYRVYFASKLQHAAKWREIGATHPFIQAHARWLKHNSLETPDTVDFAAEFWMQDVQDVKDADFVIVYGEAGEHLRGALVESGLAIAFKIPVIVIGEHEDYGTWQHHPGVMKAPDLEFAFDLIKQFTPRYRNL
jgi:nucleoside 2-deoxyribosyltransferase